MRKEQEGEIEEACVNCGAICAPSKMYEHTNGDKTCDDCKDEFKRIIEEENMEEKREEASLIVELSAGKSFTESAVLDIVDRCFHCYASDFRGEAKERAQDIMDGK